MISIIIPVYNASERLPKMLDCVLTQEYTDYEVVLVDDGSTDRSGIVCEEYAAKDHRFKVIHQHQKGAAEARNHGLEKASGELITFLDADDEIPENYLMVLSQTLMETKADITVCDVSIIENGNEYFRFTLKPDCLSKTEAMNHLLTRKNINSGPCAKLFRKEVIDGLAFPELDAYEDIVFVRNAFDRAAYISTTDKTEYRYISNKNGIMSQFNQQPSMDIVKASEDLVIYIENHPELSSDCLYVTLSHLYQNVQKEESVQEDGLLNNAIRTVFKKHWKSIIKCSAFSWKEKILFLSFAHGLNV